MNYVAQSNQMYGNSFGEMFRGLGDATKNFFTGDLTYARNLETLGFQNAYNSREAKIQRDWQERMSNTSYQRAVADLKKAGLNPYLAYSQGGASVPSGASAHSGSAYAPNPQGIEKLLGFAVQTALSLASTGASLARESMRGNMSLDIADRRNQTALDIANKRNQTALDIATMRNETAKDVASIRNKGLRKQYGRYWRTK